MLAEFVCYILAWISTLFIVQLLWQLIIAFIKHYYLWKLKLSQSNNREASENGKDSSRAHDDTSSADPSERGERVALGIPYIRFMGQLLGLTGDNSPKKRIIAHDLWKSLTLVFIAHILTLQWYSESFSLSLLPWRVVSLLLAFGFTAAQKMSNIFFLLKIYSEAGFGFNLYYKGYRVIGLDYHAWQIRQDPITGKPLPRDKQFWSRPRPHLDIPAWNLHHWPFDQFDDAATLEARMAEKSAQRVEKQARKEEKRKRREEKLRLKEAELTQRQSATIELDNEPALLPNDTNADEVGMNAQVSMTE